MKLTNLVFAQIGIINCETDVYYNYDHKYPELAELTKWNDLAQKFFRNHGQDLRRSFVKRWNGSNGRFTKEIKKLETAFNRKCSSKHLVPRSRIEEVPESSNITHYDYIDYMFWSEPMRKKKSVGDELRVLHNPGHKLRHIVHNVHQWTEVYLTGCRNQEKIVKRWGGSNKNGGFIKRFENQIEKSPALYQEFQKEEKFLRTADKSTKPCGRIYSKFGLDGNSHLLYDASVNSLYGLDDMRNTEFGNDELMSMAPYPGRFLTKNFPIKALESCRV